MELLHLRLARDDALLLESTLDPTRAGTQPALVELDHIEVGVHGRFTDLGEHVDKGGEFGAELLVDLAEDSRLPLAGLEIARQLPVGRASDLDVVTYVDQLSLQRIGEEAG